MPAKKPTLVSRESILNDINSNIKEVEYRNKIYRIQPLTSRAAAKLTRVRLQLSTMLQAILEETDLEKLEDGKMFDPKSLQKRNQQVEDLSIELNFLKIVYSLVDANNQPLFTEDDVAEVERIPIQLTTFLIRKINELNKLVDLEFEEVKKN